MLIWIQSLQHGVVVGHDAWTEHTAGEVWYPNEDVGDKHVYGCGTSLVSGPPLRPTSSWISENVRQFKMGRPESLVNPPSMMPG